jgi:N-acetylglutamate synthase-like GNAT family acetyltransferase
VVEALLDTPVILGVERTYLMTTRSKGFYQQLGFNTAEPQQLLIRNREASG